MTSKRGVSAFAYPTTDAASPLLCTLVIKFKREKTPVQATISLRSAMLIHGFDGEQAFTLQYDADNMTANTLGPASIALPQTRLDQIARHGRAQIQTLTLRLKTVCPVWCPPSSGLLSAKPGYEAPLHQLVKLASATEVQIVFDYNWLHRNDYDLFQQLVDCPTTLKGSGNLYTNKYRLADWTVFSPLEETGPVEAPPLYDNRKRSWRPSPSPTLSSPPPKRVLLSPAHLPGSPTEKATSTPSSKTSHPAALCSAGPLSPVALPNFQEVVTAAVSALLPACLETILPDLLPKIFAPVSSPTVSPSPSTWASYASQPSSHSPPSRPPSKSAPLSSLGVELAAHISAHVESRLTSIYLNTASHAAHMREITDNEFMDAFEQHKIELMLTKDDGLAELSSEIVSKVEEVRETAQGIAEDTHEEVLDRATEVFDDVSERLNRLKEDHMSNLAVLRAQLKTERGWLAWETEVLKRDRMAFERETARNREGEQRAGSAPL